MKFTILGSVVLLVILIIVYVFTSGSNPEPGAEDPTSMSAE